MTRPLETLVYFLRDEEYSVYHQTGQKQVPDSVFVGLEEPSAPDVAFVLEIVRINDLDVLFASGGENEGVDTYQFLIRYNLPEPVPEANKLESLIGRINSNIPIGAFGFSASNSVLYLRHLHLCSRDEVDETVFLHIVSFIRFIAFSYIGGLTAVAVGELSIAEALKGWERAGLTGVEMGRALQPS
jgi:hypothetical protein